MVVRMWYLGKRWVLRSLGCHFDCPAHEATYRFRLSAELIDPFDRRSGSSTAESSVERSPVHGASRWSRNLRCYSVSPGAGLALRLRPIGRARFDGRHGVTVPLVARDYEAQSRYCVPRRFRSLQSLTRAYGTLYGSGDLQQFGVLAVASIRSEEDSG